MQEINDIQQGLINEIYSHPNYELTLPNRYKIWKVMGRPSQVVNNEVIPSIGLYRRVSLAAIATEKVLHKWKKIFPDNIHIVNQFNLIEEYLRNEIKFSVADERMMSFYSVLEDIPRTLSEYQSEITLIPFAVNSALGAALYDELDLDENGNIVYEGWLDNELDSWDAAFYAAGAYSKGMPWEESSDKELRKEFWEWYVKEAVPQAFEKAEQYL